MLYLNPIGIKRGFDASLAEYGIRHSIRIKKYPTVSRQGDAGNAYPGCVIVFPFTGTQFVVYKSSSGIY